MKFINDGVHVQLYVFFVCSKSLSGDFIFRCLFIVFMISVTNIAPFTIRYDLVMDDSEIYILHSIRFFEKSQFRITRFLPPIKDLSEHACNG